MAGALEKDPPTVRGDGRIERDPATDLATGYLEETAYASTDGLHLNTLREHPAYDPVMRAAIVPRCRA